MIQAQDFREVILQTEPDNEKQGKIVQLFEGIEKDLFNGQQEIQPIKWHQVGRIYRLAKGFISFLVILWPYIKMIIKFLK